MFYRFRSVMKDTTGMKSWNKKMQRKKEREEVLAKFTAIESEKQQHKEDLKKRQQLNKIRREENEKKSEIVQVVRAIVLFWSDMYTDVFCPILCQEWVNIMINFLENKSYQDYKLSGSHWG